MQVVPHAPQFVASEVVSTHAPAQSVRPAPQPIVEHTPAEHTEPAAQATPHAPQFAGSVASVAQVPSQSVVAAGHAHAPPVQIRPTQAMSHPPQCTSLLFVSTHAPSHAVSPVEQAAAHAPTEQTSPAAQATSHPPQCAGSVSVSTHAVPQSVSPAPGHSTSIPPSVMPPSGAPPSGEPASIAPPSLCPASTSPASMPPASAEPGSSEQAAAISASDAATKTSRVEAIDVRFMKSSGLASAFMTRAEESFTSRCGIALLAIEERSPERDSAVLGTCSTPTPPNARGAPVVGDPGGH